MGSYFVLALISAVVGTLPWFFARKPVGAAIQGVISFLLMWWIFYANTISMVWPLFGLPGVCVVVLWLIAAGASSLIDMDSSGISGRSVFGRFSPGIFSVLLLLGAGIYGSECANADKYQKMIGTMETREWTQDVQPKSPEHMAMVTFAFALTKARTALGQDGTIGSQFQLAPEEMTLQKIGDQLWYVAPLEFSRYGSWKSRRASPGYVRVSAENPNLPQQLVDFPEGQGMQYAPSAWWDKNLERHLRNNGYLGKGLTDLSFEIDEDGKAWWVVSVFEPTIMWWGEKITGIVLVDPATGESTFYPMGQIPLWVDRAVPNSYVRDYLTWWGEYGKGWWNANGIGFLGAAHADIIEPGGTSMVYGESGEPEWVTDITSNNSADNSIVGVVYTNSRTGKSVYYKVHGGATNEAIIEAVDNDQRIKFRKLSGSYAQLYNIYGTMAVVVPLFNEADLFSGVAIVPINNRQQVAYGSDQYEALRDYERLLSNHGEQVSITGADRNLRDTTGTVDRISSESESGGGTIYYIHIVGIPHLFTSSSGDAPKLPVTKPGDRIKVQYYDSDRDVVPLYSFDNLSLPLTESKEQGAMRQRTGQQRQESEAREDSVSDEGRFKNLTPEQRRELLKQVPKKPSQNQ